MTKRICFLAAGYAAMVIGSTSMFGQTFGELTGRISDPSGAAIAGAGLTLTNVNTNGARSTASTDSGDYSFPSLPPGFYKLRAEHTGFKVTASDNIEIQVQQTVRLDLALQVGQVN
ncbi:MAG TPA: carboxypeptidase-like regulatory domain-containing protein, partial [Bryobacteraceae bacterium]